MTRTLRIACLLGLSIANARCVGSTEPEAVPLAGHEVSASVAALAVTPATCGSGFTSHYAEQVVPTSGVRQLVLTGLTGRAWPDQLLHYRVTLPASDPTGRRLVVRDVSGATTGTPGGIVEHQLDVCSTTATSRVARLTFFADHPGAAPNPNPAVGPDSVFTVGYETGTAPPPVTPPATPGYVQLENEQLWVRTPPLGEQLFGGVDLASVAASVAPILAFRLRSGTEVQAPSSFEGSKRKLTSLEVFRGATGPLINEVLLAYEFEPAAPGLPPGYWRVSVRVVRGIEMVFFEEEYDFGTEEPESSTDQWVLDLAKGWQPDRLTAAFHTGHPDFANVAKSSLVPGPSVVGVDDQPLTTVDFTSLTPFLGWGAEQYWSGVSASATQNFAGIVPLFGGAWRRYPKIAMHVASGDIKLRFELGITTPKEPNYQLSTAGDDIALPRSTARRQWGLVLGAPKTNVELLTLRGRYGSLSMNDIKEWQLDWPVDGPELAYDQYPRMLLTPQIAQLARQAAASASPPVAAALGLFYSTSGDGSIAQRERDSYSDGFLFNVNSEWMFGTYPGVFSPLTSYLGGQLLISDALAQIDDYLSWPGGIAGDDNPTKRRLMLRRIALMCYLFSHPEYAPVVSGAHQGNPTMPLNRGAALPVLAALIPNHPMATTWRDLSFDYYKTMTETYLSPGGSFRESSSTYQNAGLPFLQYPLLAFQRLGRTFEAQSLLENATAFQVGTQTPIVARYGARIWEPFGNSYISPVVAPLVTAAIYHSHVPSDVTRAQQALKAWEFSGNICNSAHTGMSGCMMAAYAAALGANNTQTVDAGSKFLPGFGVSLRGRPDTAQESFLMLRGGYNASHYDPLETGAFAFHSAGDELIGFPESGYINIDDAGNASDWASSSGGAEPWSRIRSSTPVSTTGEWTDTGFTQLADYAFFHSGLTRTGYGATAWIRRAMLLKGELADEYDYALFRDTRPAAGDTINAVHLATRLPGSSWQPTASGVDLNGAKLGRLSARVLEPVNSTGTPGVFPFSYSVPPEQPLCFLREAFAGGLLGRPESTSRAGIAASTQAHINTRPGGCQTQSSVAHSYFDLPVTAGATSSAWIMLTGVAGSPPPVPSQPTPTVTRLAEGVFKVTGAHATDYLFMRDAPFIWQGENVTFRGTAGAVRVRGTAVQLSLNAGSGEVGYSGQIVLGDAPLFCRTSVGAPPSACATTTPPPPFAIPVVTGTQLTLAPGVTRIFDAGRNATQYRVASVDGAPVKLDMLGPLNERIVIDGIIDGAITIEPYHANLTVLRGGGLFTAAGQTVSGAGPFTIDRYPDRIEGDADGRPRALWFEGLPVATTLEVDGVAVTSAAIPSIWLNSVGLRGGPHSFEIRPFDARLRTLPSRAYTLDRIPGRSVTPDRPPPAGALVFSGYGSWSDSARWSPRTPGNGDTVFVPRGSGVSVLADTPLLARLIVDGELTTYGANTRLRATDVEVCGKLTHTTNTAVAPSGGSWPVDGRVSVEGTTFTLCANGVIDVDGRGYQPGVTSPTGNGPGGGTNNGAHGAGAGHGGTGGTNRHRQLPRGAVYDDVLHPSQPGSAGGNGDQLPGGAGGGVVRISVTGRATIDGLISARGLQVSAPAGEAGGGSGGAIDISCGELAGVGMIRADGGGTQRSGGGGGGGRIALSYTTLPSTLPTLRLSAAGGHVAELDGVLTSPAGEDGEPGTVSLPDARFFPGAVVRDSLELVLGSSAAITRASLAVQDAVLYFPPAVPLQISGALSASGRWTRVKLRGPTTAGSVTLVGGLTSDGKPGGAVMELVAGSVTTPPGGRFNNTLTVNGTLLVEEGARFSPRSDRVTGVSPQISVQSATIEGALSADALGYGGTGNANGSGPGAGVFANGAHGSGAGYGGRGGASSLSTTNGGATYGSSTAPDQPGSSGGGAAGTSWPGGAGGGLISMTVTGTLAVDGSVTANGEDAQPFADGPSQAGGGSGGGIYIWCDRLSGSGAIRARGGAPNFNGGGGGGGRIAVYRRVNAWQGEAIAAPASVAGGTSTGSNIHPGSAGTVVVDSPPTVALTSPIPGAVFIKPAGSAITIPFSATASDVDGTVANVTFFNNGVSIGQDTSAPYTLNWSGAAMGPLALMASATDNSGAMAFTPLVPASVWETQNVGVSAIPGSASYSAPTFTVAGAGTGLGGSTSDVFRYAYKQVTGTNFTLTARVASFTGSTSARAGIMVRASLAAGSAYVATLFRPGAPTGVWFHRRLVTNAVAALNGVASPAAPTWLRLTRNGSLFTAFRSNDGVTWTQVDTQNMNAALGSTVFIGLATTSGSQAVLGTATFNSVTFP